MISAVRDYVTNKITRTIVTWCFCRSFCIVL